MNGENNQEKKLVNGVEVPAEGQAEQLPNIGVIEQVQSNPELVGSSENNTLMTAQAGVAVAHAASDDDAAQSQVQDDQQEPALSRNIAPAAPLKQNADLPDKIFIEKAKEIFNRTVGDPHAKKEGFVSLQAEYQQKTYGRNLKVADSGAKGS